MPRFPKHKHLHHPRQQVNTGRRRLDLSHLPEDECFDDWLAPIAAKNWIADAQITPDCLATKEQCSVYLSEISLFGPNGPHILVGVRKPLLTNGFRPK
jgi:hypothetical protein